VWDVLAIRAGHWSYDPRQTTGLHVGNVPIEELLFFVVIPTCSILALEAVRAVHARRAL
jgi:lycopene cyclase domain-containing protein